MIRWLWKLLKGLLLGTVLRFQTTKRSQSEESKPTFWTSHKTNISQTSMQQSLQLETSFMSKTWVQQTGHGGDYLTKEKWVCCIRFWTKRYSRLGQAKHTFARLRQRLWVKELIQTRVLFATIMTRIAFTCHASTTRHVFDAARTWKNVRYAGSRLMTLWEFTRIDQCKQKRNQTILPNALHFIHQVILIQYMPNHFVFNLNHSHNKKTFFLKKT